MFYYKYLIAKYISNSFGFLCKNFHYKCLMYHSIGNKIPDDYLGIYNIAKKNFEKQMNILKDLNVSNNFNDNIKNKNTYSITFDDGFSNILYNALEILNNCKIPFTIFVTPSLIKSNNSLYMNIAEIKKISENKFCKIGAHGYQHDDITLYSREKINLFINNSKKWLEDITGKEVDSFSYPFGKNNLITEKGLLNNNFKFAFTSQFGSNKKISNPLKLKRIDIWSFDSDIVFKSKLSGQWDWVNWVNN